MAILTAASNAERRAATWALGALTVGNFLATIDEFAFTLLLEPIKRDLGASDRELSLLAGLAFVLPYAAFAIPLARWVDRSTRRTIFALCLAAWSAMTAACGLATGFVTMALARAGLGIGQAGGAPAALSLISDSFPSEERARAMGIFQAGTALTAFVGTPFVGLVAERLGWRAAFVALALPGFFVALVTGFTVREPARGAMDPEPASTLPSTSTRSAFDELLRNPAFVSLFLSQVLCGTGLGALAAWSGAFLVRVHEVSLATLGAIVAPLYGPFMLAGSIGGGVLASKLVAKTGSDRWMVLVPALATLFALPMVLGLLLLPSLWSLLACGALMNFFFLARNGPIVALALDLVPASIRALAGALMLMATNVIGAAFGPLVVGVVSDALVPRLGEGEALRLALLATAPPLLAAGALVGLLPLRHPSHAFIGARHA